MTAEQTTPASARRKERPNIRRRGNSWTVRYYRDGKNLFRSFKTREEAERHLAEARLRKALRQPEPQLGRRRFDDYARGWLEHMRGHVARSTWESYEGLLRCHIVPELGPRLLTEITRAELDAVVSDWVAGGPRYQERVRQARHTEAIRAADERRDQRPIRLGHSPKTVSNGIVVLKEMLGQGVEWGLLSVNPAAGVRRPRPTQRVEETMQVLDPDQVHRLLDAAEEGQERTLLLAAVTTGARRGELLGVRWADVDRERNRLWIRRSIGRNGEVQTPKTRRSVRAIAMTGTLSTALRDHRMGSRFKGADDFVFASERGTPLDGRNVSRAFTAVLKRSGLPTIRFHDLRHTFASLLIAQGAHPKFISEQLGHASSQITMDRYSHLLDQSYADESEKLEAALFGNTTQFVARVTP